MPLVSVRHQGAAILKFSAFDTGVGSRSPRGYLVFLPRPTFIRGSAIIDHRLIRQHFHISRTLIR